MEMEEVGSGFKNAIGQVGGDLAEVLDIQGVYSRGLHLAGAGKKKSIVDHSASEALRNESLDRGEMFAHGESDDSKALAGVPDDLECGVRWNAVRYWQSS